MLLAWGLSCVALPAWAEGDFDSAVAAYEAGDYAAARQLWEQALAAGDWAAARSLGTLYRKGLGVDADAARAVDYYHQAMAHGVANADINLAEMILTGQGVPRDVDKAKALLKTAADQGNPAAQFRLDEIEDAETRAQPPPALAAPPPAMPIADGVTLARALVGSYGSDDEAASAWMAYNLPGLTPQLEPAFTPGQSRLIRLYAVGPEDIVTRLCDDVRSRGEPCLISK
ncbi:MAG TPA: tetratricopeptide repeat protein [Patescibacteria group bacterium]|nr:tetratricopeptide repeat protein [Patescibacteria group bacterium]